jgi:hypothetical protein
MARDDMTKILPGHIHSHTAGDGWRVVSTSAQPYPISFVVEQKQNSDDMAMRLLEVSTKD